MKAVALHLVGLILTHQVVLMIRVGNEGVRKHSVHRRHHVTSVSVLDNMRLVPMAAVLNGQLRRQTLNALEALR